MSEDYARARRLALKQARRDAAEGRCPYPPALDDILKEHGCQKEVPVGTIELDPALVVGTRTRGRQNVFSSTFMPLPEEGSEFEAKWSALFDSVAEEGIREPVVVYEYLQRFYVQEGNKRVSVARCLDIPAIEARVTRVLPLPSDDAAVRAYRSFTEFYRVCPIYGIQATDEGTFAKLASLAGHDLVEPWPSKDVHALKALLFKFRMAFVKYGGEALGLQIGDAFLSFIEVVGYERARSLTLREISGLVEGMWAEFEVASAEESNAYLEEPSAGSGVLETLARIARGGGAPKAMRVAFLYDEDPAISGWDALHEQGRLSFEARLGGTVKTWAFANCSTSVAFDAAMDEAMSNGCELVVSVQPTQMADTLREALGHPDVTFFNCSVSLSHGAVRTFACRMYEAKFLLGALAASMAANHLVGYVAESPVYSTVAEINAFACGAAMVDPYAKVLLAWISTKGYDWREQLVGQGATIISGRDNQDPKEPDRPWGLFRVGDGGDICQLAYPVWDWGRYYELIVRSLRAGTARREEREHDGQALNYWWGLSSQVLDVGLRETVPKGQRELVGLLREALIARRTDPFAGTLISQGGLFHEGPGRLSPEQIVRMDWLNENVVGSIPSPGELVEPAREQVSVAGIAPLVVGH